jgi:DNA-binding transcriptional MerR regulator
VVSGVDERYWKVGELAAATGLTVRSLHYFDEIGLLRPAQRSAAGHRLYDGADVRRLHRILTLRRLGVPLSEVRRSLEGGTEELADAVRRQMAHVEHDFERLTALQQRLARVLAVLAQGREPPIDDLIDAMEAMMQHGYFTPEQLEAFENRHRNVGAGAFAEWERRWSALDGEARNLVAQGADPADPEALALARRWAALMHDMSGGEPRTVSAMYAKLDGKGADSATRGVVSAEAWSFVKRALEVGFLP